MPVYSFEAVDLTGRRIKEEFEAESLEEFFSTIERRGLVLLKYKVKKTRVSFFARRVKRKELAEFLHNLAFMLRSGIPLISALEDLISETKNLYFVRKLKKILGDISSGSSFFEAAERARLFPPIVIALIRIGEESGALDRTLEEASRHLYRIDEIISQTKKAMVYPSFVIFSMCIAFGVWFFYVLPQLSNVFKSMNLKLPTFTLLLLSTAEAVKHYFLLGLFVVVFLAVAIFLLYKNKKTQIYVEKVWLKIPLLGRIKRLNLLAFFFEFFSLLLQSGVDLLRTLDIMEASFTTSYPKKMVQRIKNAVLEGRGIGEALAGIPILKRMDLRMIAVGESTGRLPDQLKMLADFYYAEVKSLMDSLTKILEPVLLVVAGAMFLIIILALIMPVYNLISRIGAF